MGRVQETLHDFNIILLRTSNYSTIYLQMMRSPDENFRTFQKL